MGSFRAILAVLAVALLAATLGACGGEEDPELLPGETASEINANLNLVEDLVASGDCVGAANAAAAVGEQVEALSGVDRELQENLAQGAGRLNEVVGECTEAPEEDETTAEEPDLEELEREEKAAEKEAEKEQKAEEKQEKETPPTETPGEEEQDEEAELPPTEEDGGTPAGGVSPSAPAGGGE